jgi:hypothetical protein
MYIQSDLIIDSNLIIPFEVNGLAIDASASLSEIPAFALKF